jgi:DNA-directed RNA polymerase subunit M/transcription elongation factor TFIIS
MALTKRDKLMEKIHGTLGERLIRRKRGHNADTFGRLCSYLVECAYKLPDPDCKSLIYALGTRDTNALREQLCEFFNGDSAHRRTVLADIVHSDAREQSARAQDDYMRARTNTPLTEACPQCKQASLSLRVFAGAAAGSAGGKAVQRSKSHCRRCGYSEEH